MGNWRPHRCRAVARTEGREAGGGRGAGSGWASWRGRRVWQQSHGTPPLGSYHDRECAAKMREIGLEPSTTGLPGGEETGQSVSHYIISGGRYAKAYAKLQTRGFQLHWESAPAGKQAKVKRASKAKFTCSECGQNAWAKPDALLGCYACYEENGENCAHAGQAGRQRRRIASLAACAVTFRRPFRWPELSGKPVSQP